jgi:starch-binding outer membrane protein, SusD/RagB family
MKIFIKNYGLKTLCIVFVLNSLACKDLIEIGVPNDKVIASEVYKNDGTATSAMLGVYAMATNQGGSISTSGVGNYTGLSADELYRNTPLPAVEEFRNNSLTETNSILNTFFWTPGYNYIFITNNVIEGLENSKALSPGTKNQLLGEAKFMRAYFYFHLVNLFGGVPLVLSTDYKVTAMLPRADSKDVYKQIIADLSDAKNLLSASYISSGKVRPNKAAASAFLARVYLYEKNWVKAEQESSEVINNSAYSLISDLNKVFLANSAEAVFQLMPNIPITTSTINTVDGFNYIPNANARPTFNLTTNLLDAFPAADKRKANWTKSTVVGGMTYTYPFKYQVKTGPALTEYYMLFRLAEQFLIRAEARAEQNKLPLAIADVDVIKSRAGIPLITNINPGISQPALLDEIMAERQRELFMEGGHRWYDLKRRGKAGTVLAPIKPNWKPTAELYPIPYSEIRVNPFLVQNPGY